PDDEEGCVRLRSDRPRRRALTEEVRPGEAGQPDQAEAEELPPAQGPGAGRVQFPHSFHLRFPMRLRLVAWATRRPFTVPRPAVPASENQQHGSRTLGFLPACLSWRDSCRTCLRQRWRTMEEEVRPGGFCRVWKTTQ